MAWTNDEVVQLMLDRFDKQDTKLDSLRDIFDAHVKDDNAVANRVTALETSNKLVHGGLGALILATIGSAISHLLGLLKH